MKVEADGIRMQVLNSKLTFEVTDWRKELDRADRERHALATRRLEPLTEKKGMMKLTNDLILPPKLDFSVPKNDSELLAS